MKAEHALASRKQAERRGRRSETIASLLLMAKGNRILGRRVKTHLGEIDLVAKSPRGVLCFIEVKARGTTQDAHGSIGLRQQARIVRAAALYLAKRPGLAAKGVRYDAVIVAAGRLPAMCVTLGAATGLEAILAP
jgi:putative endonuclease